MKSSIVTINRGVFVLAALIVCVAAPGCATKPPAEDAEALAWYKEKNDPLEPFNRRVLDTNRAVQEIIVDPFITGYRFILPKPARRGLYNFFKNLNEPLNFVHHILQGHPKLAGQSLARLTINTTAGIGGLRDQATHWGLQRHEEDLGQTFAVWGVPEGPYLVLPLLGPASVRHGFGQIGDIWVDPVTWVLRDQNKTGMRWGRIGGEIVTIYDNTFDTLNDLEDTSVDFYAALRSWYRENRKFEIYNGNPPPEDDPFEQFEQFDDFGALGDFAPGMLAHGERSAPAAYSFVIDPDGGLEFFSATCLLTESGAVARPCGDGKKTAVVSGRGW